MAYYRWGTVIGVEPMDTAEGRPALTIALSLLEPGPTAPSMPITAVVQRPEAGTMTRSVQGGELAMLVHAPDGSLMQLDIGDDHPHEPRCVTDRSCRSVALWVL